MGACDFTVFGKGTSHEKVFMALVEQSQFDYGHAGYTGTIAEKMGYVLIKDTPEQVSVRLMSLIPNVEKAHPKLISRLLSPNRKVSAHGMAEALIVLEDTRIDDKWGPAGCIEVTPPQGKDPGEYLFFGWASS